MACNSGLPQRCSQIRLARPELEDRRLRLIYSGQLLADSTQLYPRIASVEQRRKKPTQRSSSGGEGDDDEDSGSGAAPTWLHCSVGPQLQEGEEEEARIQVCASPTHEFAIVLLA